MNPLSASYFQQLQQALANAGLAEPALVIDRDRLDTNIAALKAMLPEGMAYRIVAKSLPCAELLEYIAAHTETHRLMSFNTNMVMQLLTLMPEANQLLGKPIPVQALRRTLDEASTQTRSQLQHQVQWLIDTPARLVEYAELAKSANIQLQINLEIDVGLHRGGMAPGADLEVSLKTIHQSTKRAKQGAADQFQQALTQTAAIFGQEHVTNMVRNMAGSPTFGLYSDTLLANEIAAGSALVKPSDFDLPILKAFLPASFIATPAIKVSKGVRLPGLEYANRALGKPQSGKTVFLHGGYWKANPVYPGGLKNSSLFGRSSNQEMLVAPKNASIKVDDFVFLRPTQSEAVFLQFPKIAVFSGGQIKDLWAPLPVTA
jgi:D-serine deaminase-like pyridoxal phosphate-dependent protein